MEGSHFLGSAISVSTILYSCPGTGPKRGGEACTLKGAASRSFPLVLVVYQRREQGSLRLVLVPLGTISRATEDGSSAGPKVCDVFSPVPFSLIDIFPSAYPFLCSSGTVVELISGMRGRVVGCSHNSRVIFHD